MPSKYCVYCGNPIKDSDKFCIICGKPVLRDLPKKKTSTSGNFTKRRYCNRIRR
ncbi:MAG: zinc-ribbon domain-containing protein [Promethearchaeota archaeon]